MSELRALNELLAFAVGSRGETFSAPYCSRVWYVKNKIQHTPSCFD